MGIISSCSEEDLGPAPVTEFAANAKVAEVGESIKFTNSSSLTSGESLTYSWDFGDGSTSTDANPTKRYQSTGTYPVMLTATSASGASAVMSDTIRIGERYLSSLSIAAVELDVYTVVSEGDTLFGWDEDGSGPDILWQLVNVNATSQEEQVVGIETPIENFDNTQVITFTVSSNFILKNSNYYIEFVDSDDGTTAEAIIAGYFNPSDLDVYNPNTFDFNNFSGELGKDPETGEGMLIIASNLMISYLIFEIR
ncbi:PKD domain-containing protein [Flammeovirgaceae bacterium SG7u.111]|nr:PKD domain-containing protein [Flammeovirgaceae bacterium SG7u.132]WPO36813.1 PKD domain-containing protein [Flammeovirgaceae bacterium SG7u.111]